MRIYFLGICGTAMGNAALLLRAAGHEVSGADLQVYPPMSTVLEEAGIPVLEGYDSERLARLRPELVVIGNAFSRGNPEVEWLLDERQLAWTSLPALLHDFVLRRRRTIAICGTHGKTTTTALCAFLLREHGRDPGFLIGGVPLDLPQGSHLGLESDAFVIEGDEYDSAFFDKRSKFIHYAPRQAVLNNLEFDHADIFRDLEDIRRSFVHLTRLVPRSGCILVNGDDPGLQQVVAPVDWTRVWRVGMDPGNDLQIRGFSEGPDGAAFELHWKGRPWGEVSWSLSGAFNARNAAMAALAAGLELAPEDPTRLSLAALHRFRGVRRRQEVLVTTPGLVVVEDFGHHPTAIRETLRALRARFPGRELLAVFEPRSNTARLNVLQSDFADALAEADICCIGAVDRAGQLAPGDRFDPTAVAAILAKRGKRCLAAAGNARIVPALIDLCRETATPRLVVFFSNGSFDGIIAEFARLAAGSAADGRGLATDGGGSY